jgi:hypothetical protein
MDNNNSQDMDRGGRTDNNKSQITTAKALAIGLIGVIPGLVSGGALGFKLMDACGGEPYCALYFWYSPPIGAISGLVGGCLGSLCCWRIGIPPSLGAIIGGAIGGIAGPAVVLLLPWNWG